MDCNILKYTPCNLLSKHFFQLHTPRSFQQEVRAFPGLGLEPFPQREYVWEVAQPKDFGNSPEVGTHQYDFFKAQSVGQTADTRVFLHCRFP